MNRRISINTLIPQTQAHLQQMMQSLSPIITDTMSKYPPHNLYVAEDDTVVIELAVAGFDKTDISVTVDAGYLEVSGRKTSEPTRNYMHKGIATRPFAFRTSLLEGSVIKSAKMEDGILRITVQAPKPEVKKSTSINID